MNSLNDNLRISGRLRNENNMFLQFLNITDHRQWAIQRFLLIVSMLNRRAHTHKMTPPLKEKKLSLSLYSFKQALKTDNNNISNTNHITNHLINTKLNPEYNKNSPIIITSTVSNNSNMEKTFTILSRNKKSRKHTRANKTQTQLMKDIQTLLALLDYPKIEITEVSTMLQQVKAGIPTTIPHKIL